jgi:hypothetical protein
LRLDTSSSAEGGEDYSFDTLDLCGLPNTLTVLHLESSYFTKIHVMVGRWPEKLRELVGGRNISLDVEPPPGVTKRKVRRLVVTTPE